MKKLTTSVLAVVLSSSFAMLSAQEKGADTTNIREIVVTGAMGIKKRQDAVTSSSKVLTAADLNSAKSPNAVQALTGKVSGLVISQTNSSVNPTQSISLRGFRTMSGSTEPIVVIDGVVSSMAVLQQLAPEVIESTNVLKGQQGAALYGPAASNGAIVVTTVKGSKSEKIVFKLTNSVETTSMYKLPIYQKKYGQGWPGSGSGYIDLEDTTWVPYENSNWGPSYAGALGGQVLDQGLPDANGNFVQAKYAPIDDHTKLFFKNGVTMQNGLSMNVGGRDSYAFLSVNRLENNFTVEGDQLVRNTFTFKAGKQVGKFRIDGTFNFIDSNTKANAANLWYQATQTATNVDIRRYANRGIEGNNTLYTVNPYWLRDNLRTRNNNTIFNGTATLQYTFNENINLVYNGTITTQGIETENWNNGFKAADLYAYPTTTPYGSINGAKFSSLSGTSGITSAYSKSISKYWRYYSDLMLNFNYDLSDKVNLRFTIGNNIQDSKYDIAEVGGTNLDIPGWYNIKNTTLATNWSSLDNNKSRNRTVAFFANADLSYQDYLFLNATVRYDQMSILSFKTYADGVTNPLKNKGFFYPSVGLSFIPTKAFTSLKGDILNYAKISASYVRTGGVGPIGTYSTDQIGLMPTGFPFGDVSSYLIQRSAVDQNITPEFNNTLEGNISLGFLKDRITVDASAYRTKTENLITTRTTPTSSGISSVLSNIGNLTNKGFEVDLGLTPIKSKDFEWKVGAGYTTYKTTVDELADGQDRISIYAPSAISGNWPVGIFAVKGESLPVIMGTAYTRDPNGNIVVDANGLPEVSQDYKILGKVDPKYILNFNTSIKLKNFTVSAVADYRTGNKFFSGMMPTMGFTGSLEKSANFDRQQGYIIPGSVQNTGTAANPVYVTNTTPVGDDASYEGVVNYFSGVYDSVAEEFVIDGSAFKIREIAVSYDVPRDVLSGTFVRDLSVGLYARNPFAWYAKENRNYADPETSFSGGLGRGLIHNQQLPAMRTFGFNVNITF